MSSVNSYKNVENQGFKTCKQCKQTKPLDGFYPNQRVTIKNLVCACIECMKLRDRKYYKRKGKSKKAKMRRKYRVSVQSLRFNH